jgi:hypothetical protein
MQPQRAGQREMRGDERFDPFPARCDIARHATTHDCGRERRIGGGRGLQAGREGDILHRCCNGLIRPRLP